MERGRDISGSHVARPYTFISVDNSKNERVGIYGISLSKEGKSAMMIFDRHANLKYKFGNRNFWATGYYVSTVGLNEKR